MDKTITNYLAKIGRKGGQSKSEKKLAAVRQNRLGKLLNDNPSPEVVKRRECQRVYMAKRRQKQAEK